MDFNPVKKFDQKQQKYMDNSRAKMGENLGPKMGENSFTKLSENKGPKIVGFEGIGPGIEGTQKVYVPCNFYMNPQNHNRHENMELQMNTEMVLNNEHRITFTTNDDILQMLKTHPEFQRIPPDSLQPIIAGILSGILAAAGTIVLIMPLAATALVVKVIAGAAVSAGISGVENSLKHGFNGTFTWKKWTADIGIAASTTLITMGSSMFTIWKTTTTFMLNTKEISIELLEYIVKRARIVGTLIGNLTSSAAEAITKVVKDEKINPIMLVMAFLTGGLQGYSAGTSASEKAINDRLKKLIETSEELLNHYRSFWTSQENFWSHLKKHGKEFRPDFSLDGVEFKFEDAKTTVLSIDTINKLKKLESIMESNVYGKASMDALLGTEDPLCYYEIEKEAFLKVCYDKEKKVLCLTNINNKTITAHKSNKFPKKFNSTRFYKIEKQFLDLIEVLIGSDF